ncbi:MAG TPA: cupin domain-containing protein [Candidatus Goldiibacteriota bacterium]|nr:cupin domain-containing protein [Candidatus Goldiibacteriota bacterium]
MKKINESEVAFKYVTSGPKYLFNDPGFSGGIAYLKPGDEIKPHMHDDEAEIFYFIDGGPEFIAEAGTYAAKAGDAFQVEAGEKHAIKNNTGETARMFFLKVKRGSK